MGKTDYAARVTPPAPAALTRSALARLRERGELSAPAWEHALEFCGFIPGRREWFIYWRQIFLLAGAIFFLSGVIFFIAANWAGMHRFLRMALVGGLVAGSGLGSLAAGLDTRIGRVLLLSCGIAIGPMLAVFGQTYQSGAELWELFRTWTVLLLLLAIAGKQPALWFVTWLSGNVFVMLWLGRSMTGPIEALGMFSLLPESLFILAFAVAAWEWAAWRHGEKAGYSWLEARWLPRLLFFDLACRITVYLIMEMFDAFFRVWRPELLLPPGVFVPALGLAAACASWFWHRKKTPDLFMLAVVLASLAVLLVAFLIRVEFLFYDDVSAVLAWGLLIAGLSGALGKALLVLQRSMESSSQTGARTPRPGAFFSGFSRRRISWEQLWDALHARGYLPQGYMHQGAPAPLANEAGAPWYVQCLLAAGGWLAALLLMAFLVLLLFFTLRIRSNEGIVLLCAALPVLAAGAVTLRASGVFLRHFGFALALAGTGCAAAGLFIAFGDRWLSFFLAGGFVLAACVFVNSDVFRFLGAVFVSCCTAMGVAHFANSGHAFWGRGNDVSFAFTVWAAYAPAIWWAALSVGFVVFHLREKKWRGTVKGSVAEPVLYGMFAGMLLCQILALSSRFGTGAAFSLLPVGSSRSMALGAAAGLICLALVLVKARKNGAERGFVMFCATASLPLAWFLPGAALAFFGLAVARFIGNVVMQGATAVYFFMYMVYYYYFLGVSLLTKSLFLATTGVLLLLFAYCLGRYAAGMTEGEEADA